MKWKNFELNSFWILICQNYLKIQHHSRLPRFTEKQTNGTIAIGAIVIQAPSVVEEDPVPEFLVRLVDRRPIGRKRFFGVFQSTPLMDFMWIVM